MPTIFLPRMPFDASKLTIGADVEGETVVGRLIVAARDLPSPTLSKVDGEEVGRFGNMGADGSGEPMEFRPRPSRKPNRMVANLAALFRAFYARGYRLSVSGHKFSSGSHVHFGGDAAFRQIVNSEGSRAVVLRMFDDFVGRRLLALSGRGRVLRGYKKLGGSRDKPYGFEYRSVPAPVFQRPDVFLVTVTLMLGLLRELSEKGVSYRCDMASGTLPEEYEARMGAKDAKLLLGFVKRFPVSKRNFLDEKSWGIR